MLKQVQHDRRWYTGFVARIFATLILILMILLFPPAVLAVISNDAIPGQPTYPIKRALEAGILKIASIHPTAYAWFSAERSDRRFFEATTLISLSKEQEAKKSFNELVVQTREAVSEIENVQSETSKNELKKKLAGQIKKYKAEVEKIDQQVKSQQPSGGVVNPTPTSIPGAPYNTPYGTPPQASPTPTLSPGQPSPTPRPPSPTPTPVPPTPTQKKPSPTPKSPAYQSPPYQSPPTVPSPTPTPVPPVGGEPCDLSDPDFYICIGNKLPVLDQPASGGTDDIPVGTADAPLPTPTGGVSFQVAPPVLCIGGVTPIPDPAKPGELTCPTPIPTLTPVPYGTPYGTPYVTPSTATPQPVDCTVCDADVVNTGGGRVDSYDMAALNSCASHATYAQTPVYGSACSKMDKNGNGKIDQEEVDCANSKFGQICVP